MADLATVTGRLLTNKGMARPMLTQGAAHRGAENHKVMWHPAVNRRLVLAPTGGTSPGPLGQASLDACSSTKRTRASLRLDHDLHQRLKAQGAMSRRTQQSILQQALEEFLDRQDTQQSIGGDRRRPTPA